MSDPKNYGRCNNCWLVIKKALQDGACPRCGCYVHHANARRCVSYHGKQGICHFVRCPRRFKDGKRNADGEAG